MSANGDTKQLELESRAYATLFEAIAMALTESQRDTIKVYIRSRRDAAKRELDTAAERDWSERIYDIAETVIALPRSLRDNASSQEES